MTVKVKRKIEALGSEFYTSIYLPEDMYLTRDRREKADKLDEVLKAKVNVINFEYEHLDKRIKNSEINKWKWLGSKIDQILFSTALIEKIDKDNHHIWPAIGQYLRPELSRGLDDKKRSGTKSDHYRKCWALATLPGTEWITNWIGWDAFTDRGEQLAYSGRLLPLLEKKFKGYSHQLKGDDYKQIAKLLVEHIPTKSKTPKDIESLSDSKLDEIAEAVYKDFSDKRL